MQPDHAWKRKFVAYVERSHVSKGYTYLTVKVPNAVATSVERRCAELGHHSMVYYCDAFAVGLSDALTIAETKTLA